MAVKCFVGPTLQANHLNNKFYFLEVFAILRVCTAKRNRENAAFSNICFDWLKLASDRLIVFVECQKEADKEGQRRKERAKYACAARSRRRFYLVA